MNNTTIQYRNGILSTDDTVSCDLQLTTNELNTLLRDKSGNIAKEFAVYGNVIRGTRPTVLYDVRHPRPTSISNIEMLHNLDTYGYGMITTHKVYRTRIIRPEYVVVNAVYDFDMRHLTSGVPVILAKAPIIWSLMRYEAERYMFAEILLGALIGLDRHGIMPPAARQTVRILENKGIQPVLCADLPKTIRTYNLTRGGECA